MGFEHNNIHTRTDGSKCTSHGTKSQRDNAQEGDSSESASQLKGSRGIKGSGKVMARIKGSGKVFHKMKARGLEGYKGDCGHSGESVNPRIAETKLVY